METASQIQSTASRFSNRGRNDALARSVLSALAYADLFDYPLTRAEIVRYQVGTSFSSEEIDLCLATSPDLQGAVSKEGDLYCLSGREDVFKTRRSRALASRIVWERAQLYARWMRRLPFVRMVAVTGALAVDNIAARPDIDLLIVAEDGRVWICRRLTIGLVRLARFFGDDLCPNYIIAESKLDLDQQDFFTAHELAQMVPLYGRRLYQKMMAQNSWAAEYLPSAFSEPAAAIPSIKPGTGRRVIEGLLKLPLFNYWERWELERLQRKLRPVVGDAAEVICSAEQCKGHTGLHRQWVTNRYRERLSELGL